ncbi:acyl-CoA dehydrogenase family protein [Kocuria tytonis]|uniref:Acyl-CoA dehydrogenase n=1 Tax=Kocuria tytonis TaxID=2054280 RepID=A0A495A8N0_9MICC|nr:acyl-CoA dehydrogenase family protein [Kocuria tytonis]RKQ36308.1 acyl-CoA dehydrogenase [Kocuria tytonis]
MDPVTELLPDDLLAVIRARAADVDRENRFFTEDFTLLREIGYLRMLVPREFGGLGFSLEQAARAQRRLATAAPATALGINMHHVIVGIGYTLHLRGDERARQILDAAAAGEVFAFGISEAGNDSVLFDATTRAEPTAGGWRLHGTKIFTSLSPRWTRLLVHARVAEDASAGTGDAGAPTTDDAAAAPLVFGFLTRPHHEHPVPGVQTLPDWDALGMRASQSCTTVLDGAVLRETDVLTSTPAGPNPDPVVWGVFGCFELLLAAVYTGIADRAIEVAVGITTSRRSLAKGAPYSDDPDIRRHIARAGVLRDGVELQLRQLCADVDSLGSAREAAHGARWFILFSGVKHRATEAAREVVDLVLRASGGAQYRRGSELERLYRDVLAGMYHPSDAESVHAATANSLLGPVSAG